MKILSPINLSIMILLAMATAGARDAIEIVGMVSFGHY